MECPRFEKFRITISANTPRSLEDFSKLQHRLNTAKSQLNGIPDKVYQALANAYDPYFTLKRQIDAPGVTNAWLKMTELLAEMNLRPTTTATATTGAKQTKPRFHFEAEFPGAMIMAALYQCPGLDWVASSLAEGITPAGSNGKALGDTYGLYKNNRQRWLMGQNGKDTNNGDLTNPKVVVQLARAVRESGGATHYMADGGFEVADHNRQEELTGDLNAGQITCGLLSLSPGGCFMTKQYTFFTPRSINTITYLAGVFDEFWITKPRASRRLNSEIYLVGKGFKGLGSRDRLTLIGGSIPQVSNIEFFTHTIYGAADRLATLQIACIEELCRNKHRNARTVTQEQQQRTQECQREWCEVTGISPKI
jgi:hypothetical protein